MKRLFNTISTLLLVFSLLFGNAGSVLASGEDGGHLLEKDVNGYHVALSSQNDWARGANTLVVTLTDSMGMPVSHADVEILIAQESNGHAETDGHGEPVSDSHAEADTHGTETQHDSMPGMEMGESEPDTTGAAVHGEGTTAPIEMTETHEQGVYLVETHLESSGEHEVQVMFHVNGEMLQADFKVEVPGIASKTIILWSFVTVNLVLVASAGFLKKQLVPMKGAR